MNNPNDRRRGWWALGPAALAIVCLPAGRAAAQDAASAGKWLQRPTPAAQSPPSREGRLASTAPTQSAKRPGEIYWNKADFVIPFNVSPHGKPPASVELEVSVDEGRNWASVQRSDLSQRQFAFRSRGDGLYWFRIKTLDAAGAVQSLAGDPMVIVIDTRRPEVDLVVDTDEQAKMVADFRIADANLAAADMRLEYQTELDGSWVKVPLSTQFGRDASELVGKASWEPPVRARQMIVRLLVKDAAGNETEVTRLPSLMRTADSGGGLQLASGDKGMFGSMFGSAEADPAAAPSLGSPAASVIAPPPGVAIVPRSSLSTGPRPSVPAPTPTSDTREVLPSPDPVNRYNAARESSATPVPAAANPFPQQPPMQLQQTDRGTALILGDPPAPDFGGSRYELREIAPSPTPAGNAAAPPAGLPINLSNVPASPVSQVPSPPAAAPSQATPSPASRSNGPSGPSAAGAKTPYASNSREFSLDYAVDMDPSNSVSAVELWGTVDGGRIWSKWGSDPDKRSPFDIRVQTDGLFGFRMVIVGSNGVANHRPMPGDDADAWIEVDTVPPTASIASAQYGSGAEAGSLVIVYQAADDRIADGPITLSYAESLEGPWVTIDSGVANTGRYVWQGNPNLPRRVFLRVEAYDKAGNVFGQPMDLPVDLEGLAPRGRIQGFRPIRP